MRNIILASAFALAATLSTGVAANAQGMHHPHHKVCTWKKVKHRDGHGHWVVKKVRVCR